MASVTWAVLLLLGLFGQTLLGLPQLVTDVAGTMAVLAVAFLIPLGTMYALLLERRSGAIRTQGLSTLAIRRRWQYAIAGGWATLVGSAVILPSIGASSWIKVAGAVVLVWGLLCVSVAVLAFRMKPLIDER